MATVTDEITSIKGETGYVTNSIHLKSSDQLGATYKYLIKTNSKAVRKEKFFELDHAEEETVSDWGNRTVLNVVEVDPAQ